MDELLGVEQPGMEHSYGFPAHSRSSRRKGLPPEDAENRLVYYLFISETGRKNYQFR